MSSDNLKSKPRATRSVNISVVKPNGISSLWSWFTSKDKKTNLQNLMYDKKIKLKLNAEELDILKSNGIDLKKLQTAALSTDFKIGKNIFILSKDQIGLNKNDLLNSSILGDIIKNKEFSKKTKKYKRSLVSSSSLSIKSKNNITNSKMTYIHSIKSKKSIVNSVSSKASLKVGLRSSSKLTVVNPKTKNILLKGIPEALLRGNMQKKVFVPIYLGKKSSKKVKEDKPLNDDTEIKETATNESNVIPLLLNKLKTMEGQICDIENTTKKIDEAVSQRNMYNINNSPKESKFITNQPKSKPPVTHKMYPKRSVKKCQQSKLDRSIKAKTNSPKSYISSNNTEFSFTSATGLNYCTKTNTTGDQLKNIKNIISKPENLKKYNIFTLPRNLAEKTGLKANTNADVGCDVILKLFEESLKNNDSYNETTSEFNEKNETLKNNDCIISDKKVCSSKQHLGSNENPNYLLSISESQVDLINNQSNKQSKTCADQKRNISCPTSSTVMRYNNNDDKTKPALKNRTKSATKREKHRQPGSLENRINHNSVIKHVLPDIKDKKVIEKSGNVKKSHKHRSIFSLPENLKFVKVDPELKMYKIDDESINNFISLNKSPPPIITGEPMECNQFYGSSESTVKKDHGDFNMEKNVYIKEFKFQVPERQLENQIITLPINTECSNVCNISIEQAVEPDDIKQTEVVVKGSKLPDAKKEPKFSITIMVKNNQNGEKLYTNEDGNKTKTNPFIELKDNKIIENNILPLNGGDNLARFQSKEKSVTLNSEKYIPPLKLETSDAIATSVTFSGFADSNKDEKGFQTINLKHKTDQFGIKGVVYLNQKQRKKFDEQHLNNISSKKSKEQTQIATKPETKSFTDLKIDYTPVRHLSVSSLNRQKTAGNNLSQQSPRISETGRAIENCGKTPLQLKPFTVITKEPVNRSGAMNKNSTKRQDLRSETGSEQINKGESNFIENRKYSTPSSLNHKDSLQDIINPLLSKTLPKKYIEELKPRHQRTFFSKIEYPENGSIVFVPLNNAKQNTGYDLTSVNNDFADHLDVTKDSQMGKFVSQDCVLASKPAPEAHTLVESTMMKKSTHSEHFPTKSNAPPTTHMRTILQSDLVSLPVSDMPKCCPCILANANKTTEINFRSQAEILLEKAGPVLDGNGKISIICNTCMNKSVSANKNLKGEITVRETYNEYDSKVSVCFTDENIKEVTDFLGGIAKNKANSRIQSYDYLPIENENQLVKNKNQSFVVTDNTIDEVKDLKYQVKTNGSDDKDIPCFHACFSTPSVAYSSSWEGKPDNAFCLDFLPNEEISDEKNIDNVIFNFDIIKNDALFFKKPVGSKSAFDLIANEKGPVSISTDIKIPDEQRKRNGFVRYVESKENCFYPTKHWRDINSGQGCSLKSDKIKGGTLTGLQDQENSTQVHEIQEQCINNVDADRTSNCIGACDVGCNRGNQHPPKVDETVGGEIEHLKKMQYLKENVIMTESDKFPSNEITPNDLQCSSPQLMSSTTYVVNCIHSIAYDIMDENVNSVYTLNSWYSQPLLKPPVTSIDQER